MTIRLLTTGPFAGLPDGRAKCIVADPPWKFRTYNGEPGIKAPPYPTMSLDAIKALPVADLAANGCWVFLWTTGTFLDMSRETMRAWGARFSSVAFTWVKVDANGKPRLGLGKTTRKSTEICLLGKIGSPRVLERVPELIVARVRAHSQKPEEFFHRVERFCDSPRIELFSRQRRPDWLSWGDQVDHFPSLHEENSGLLHVRANSAIAVPTHVTVEA
jgi:N6-adenosine-specific RNA methylase IME4